VQVIYPQTKLETEAQGFTKTKKMKKFLVTVAIMAASFTSYAQVGIGTTNPQGVLDVVSADNGLILPRVANTGAVTTPVNGMIVFDISETCFKGYQNGTWSECGLMPDATAAATLAAAASNAVLVQIGNEADAAGTVPSVVTVAQLATILPALISLDTGNEAAYQAYIDANPGMFSATATAAQVQAMVYAVNVAEAPTSTDVLTQIGNEADAPDTVVSVVTVAELNSISPAITDLVVGNESQYQTYIDLNPTLFAAPATAAEVQAMVTAVNAAQAQATAEAASNAVLAQIGNEADTGGTVASVVTTAQLKMILPTLTTPSILLSNETAYQVYIDANPGLFSAIATATQIQAMVHAVNALEVGPGEVAGLAGLIWMDRNLGATQVATSSTDAAAYGNYYQWGRPADGHQLLNSSTTTTISTTTTPGHADFITIATTSNQHWFNTIVDKNLWDAGPYMKKGIDPCPTGFRIPRSSELFAEINAIPSYTNHSDAFTNSPLKLVPSGYRRVESGVLQNAGASGHYWTSDDSTTSTGSPYVIRGAYVKIQNASRSVAAYGTAYGISIRCVRYQ